MPRKTNELPPISGPTLERLPQVMARTGLARATLYRMVASGEFPQNLKLGRRSSAWNSVEVDAWIASRIALRDQGAKR